MMPAPPAPPETTSGDLLPDSLSASFSGFPPHPAGGTAPEELEAEWNAAMQAADLCLVPGLVEDMVDPDEQPLQLETRGATPQSSVEFWRSQTIWKESVVAKLLSAGESFLAEKISACHTIDSYAVCTGCRRAKKFWNRCENFWCPECQPRLARERKDAVEWWARTIDQPKHVVLTVRNTWDLDQTHVKAVKKAFHKLRRCRFARAWRGGFYSLECTNEGRGWHIHIHALIDARWIDAKELAKQWAKLVGQDFAIVKVKDCRSKDYLAEVTKYAVKGSELAGWNTQDIILFINAFTGVRTFGVFGSLYKNRINFREWLDSLHAARKQCECGCRDFKVMSPDKLEEMRLNHDARSSNGTQSRPPPETIEFDFLQSARNLDAFAR